MKLIIEYTVLNERPLRKGTPAPGIKVLSDGTAATAHPADLPQQHIEYFVPDDSQPARTIFDLLGLSLPA